ncbi:hypothetical protein Tco_1109961 [Tanacetum coccineum]|uniref:Uncharacterized protein n=1 Tax=Tanacetum coccineum TaxID=301880 RepID=A0ABQ5IJW2_9ASTR
MIYHELELTEILLSIRILNLELIEGCVSCGAELSVGEEDLLAREVPALKNSSYKGPKRRSNSCCDGTVVSAKGETFCSSDAGQGCIIRRLLVIGEQAVKCLSTYVSDNLFDRHLI